MLIPHIDTIITAITVVATGSGLYWKLRIRENTQSEILKNIQKEIFEIKTNHMKHINRLWEASNEIKITLTRVEQILDDHCDNKYIHNGNRKSQ